MKFIVSTSVGALLLATSFCASPPAEQSNKTTPVSTTGGRDQINCDWKGDVLDVNQSGIQKFLVGKWEGYETPDQGIEMYLTFQEDGTAVVDYSQAERRNVPKGRLSYRPYRINADNTLNICGYPDNFTMRRHGEDEFSLASDNKEIYGRGAIELIYICSFKRVKL